MKMFHCKAHKKFDEKMGLEELKHYQNLLIQGNEL